MTVASTDNSVNYAGDGVATVWPFSFPILDATHLAVTLVLIADGTIENISSSLYTISGLGVASGGSITYPLVGPPVPATKRIYLIRTVPYTQEVAINNQGGFLQEVVEEGLDLLEMQIQQLKALVETVQASVIAAGNVPSPAIGDVNKFLRATGLGVFGWVSLTTAMVSGISSYALLADPTFTGNPKVPTAAPGDNDTTAASTAFVTAAIAAIPAASQNVGPGGGRLSLTSGLAVLTSTVLAAATIYYVPQVGRYVPIYNGTLMTMVDIGGELSNILANSAVGKAGPAAAANNSNYDLFVWNDAGTYRLTRGPLWTSDTARGAGAGTSELIITQGIKLNANDITNGPLAQRGTWVGTIHTNGTATSDFQLGALAAGGTAGIIGVWNTFNRVNISMFVQDSADIWAYNSATWRAANNSATMRVSFISGLAEDSISAKYDALVINTTLGRRAFSGIGYDVTNAPAAGSTIGRYLSPIANADGQAVATFVKLSDLGWHFCSAIESTDATGGNSFMGDNGAPTNAQSGMTFNFRA